MREPIKIGFFDSGVGGISVMTCARRAIPYADYIFYADTEHVPFGLKDPGEIKEYATAAVGYLARRGVDAVVVACNTATSIAIKCLRETFSLPIVGMEPAIKPAAICHPCEKILLCATPVTIAGKKLHDLIVTSHAHPDLVALPELVTFAERGIFDTDTVCRYLSEKIDKRENYAAVVLGCTHFPYFRDSFREYLGDVDIIDGTDGTVKRLCTVLDDKIALLSDCDKERAGTVEYVRSGVAVTAESDLEIFEQMARRAQKMLALGRYKDI